MGGHLPDRRFGEGARHAARADENRRLHFGDHGGEVQSIGRRQAREAVGAQLGAGEGELALVVVKLVAIEEDQTLRIDGDDRPFGARGIQALGHHRRAHGASDTGPCGACAQEGKSLFVQRPAHRPHGGQDAGQHDGSRALDIVVETGDAMAVAVQYPDGVVLLEVFPLQDGVRADVQDRAHEGLEEVVVLGPAQAALAEAHVCRIGEKILVVRADIQRDGQGMGGVDARAGGVEGELADGDAHAARALIAQTEDPLVVRGDNQADVVDAHAARGGFGPGVAEQIRDAVLVGGGDPQAPRSPHDVAEGLAGAADRRRVDNRQEFFEVLDQDPIEERLVAVLQRREPDEALEIVALSPDVLELEADLLVDRGHPRWQQAAQAENVPFGLVEAGVLVQERLLEKLGAGLLDLHGPTWTKAFD